MEALGKYWGVETSSQGLRFTVHLGTSLAAQDATTSRGSWLFLEYAFASIFSDSKDAHFVGMYL